jgi:2-dehydropantoate 2-reductase
MRIGIVGAGALGSVFGALLLEKGVETVLIRRNQSEVDRIREKGLALEGVSGSRVINAPIFSVREESGKADLALVMVKAYDTEAAAPIIERILRKDGVVLTLQNGIGNFEILNQAFPGRVLLGTTTIGAQALGKGRFRHTGLGETNLGEVDGTITDRSQDIASLLEKMEAGRVNVKENAVGGVWSKLVINAAINAPATLLRVRNGDLPTTEAGRELVHSIVEECLKIIEAKGIDLIVDDPEQRVIAVCEATATNINSMLQDVLAGRRTEIDFINGALAREGERLGVPAVANATLARLIGTLEGTADKRVPDAD